MNAVMMKAFTDELQKLGGIGESLRRLGQDSAMHKTELAGLGILAVPSVDEAQAHVRAAIAGKKGPEEVEKRTFLPAAAKPISELAGLGTLAAPSIGHLMKH